MVYVTVLHFGGNVESEVDIEIEQKTNAGNPAKPKKIRLSMSDAQELRVQLDMKLSKTKGTN